jgi:hypothetical protein
MANTSIFNAFERFWHHVTLKIDQKADISHSHDDKYYTEAEVDMKLISITDDEIDAICGAAVYAASEVIF